MKNNHDVLYLVIFLGAGLFGLVGHSFRENLTIAEFFLGVGIELLGATILYVLLTRWKDIGNTGTYIILFLATLLFLYLGYGQESSILLQRVFQDLTVQLVGVAIIFFTVTDLIQKDGFSTEGNISSTKREKLIEVLQQLVEDKKLNDEDIESFLHSEVIDWWEQRRLTSKNK